MLKANPPSLNRRDLMQSSLNLFGIWLIAPTLGAQSFVGAKSKRQTPLKKPLGPLGDPDSNGFRLLPGYESRLLARSGENVKLEGGAMSRHMWHHFPDGGACFAVEDGWIYVSNSEVDFGQGGAGAMRFNSAGELIDIYPILTGTNHNCAGGATPWQTWLSCEEVTRGLVYECHIFGEFSRPLPALGAFRHEACAVDLNAGHIYMTEDQPDGCLYRYAGKLSADRKTINLERKFAAFLLLRGGGQGKQA